MKLGTVLLGLATFKPLANAVFEIGVEDGGVDASGKRNIKFSGNLKTRMTNAELANQFHKMKPKISAGFEAMSAYTAALDKANSDKLMKVQRNSELMASTEQNVTVTRIKESQHGSSALKRNTESNETSTKMTQSQQANSAAIDTTSGTESTSNAVDDTTCTDKTRNATETGPTDCNSDTSASREREASDSTTTSPPQPVISPLRKKKNIAFTMTFKRKYITNNSD